MRLRLVIVLLNLVNHILTGLYKYINSINAILKPFNFNLTVSFLVPFFALLALSVSEVRDRYNIMTSHHEVFETSLINFNF
jgi:hypothetical protein